MAFACVMAFQACTTSEDGDIEGSGDAGTTGGTAGTSAQNTAGTTGSAGTTGAAGTSSTNAGTAGTKASATGAAGTTGKAGTGGAGSVGASGAAGTSAAAGTSGTGGTGPVVYTWESGIENVITLSCGGCHLLGTSVPIKGNFGISYAQVMASVTNDHLNCPNLDATKKRVVPGKPENSMLYIKVAVPNLPGSCGGHMPANGVNMGSGQIQAVKDWILAGAKER